MIISRIKGGIGNQLFIYAASRRLSIKNKIDLVIDDVSGFAYDNDFKRNYQLDHFNISCRKATAIERLEPFSRIRRYIKRNLNRKLSFDKRNFIEEEGASFEDKFLRLQIKDKLYLEGYFQSENYFKDVELEIREDFKINPPIDNKNLLFLKKIKNSNSVAIHFRFFDNIVIASNKNLQNKSNTSINYYKDAILKMNSYLSNPHYFIFSDQPNKVTKYLPLNNDQVTIIDHNNISKMAYADLWLMSQCKHYIIAKSTFSWWGAWLSNNKEKIIIAPKIDNNQNFFWRHESLLPKKWIKL